MKALVTGGAGFIGSNIVRALLEEKHEVTVLDDLSSGYKRNIQDCIDTKGVKFVKASILDKNAVSDACAGQDVVFHLAASVGRQRSIDNPISDSSINLLGTINVLEGIKNAGSEGGGAGIVYSSSAAMFGELIMPLIDEGHPQNADSPYGVSKLAAEKMILAYSDIYNIKAVCLRYFNIYGKGQRYDAYGNVIPIFAQRIYDGEPITIYGDGSQTRDFANVHDVARANLLAAGYQGTHKVFNIGSGYSITINELATQMQKIAGKGIGIVYAPERPADVKHCTANIALAKKELGYSPSVDLSDGLKEYAEWFEEERLNPIVRE
jgi:nucleoside-diphosphate-sugar epimerase